MDKSTHKTEDNFLSMILLRFPSLGTRLKNGEDEELAKLQVKMSYLFFFRNYLTTKRKIKKFLKAQPKEFLDFIALKFGINTSDDRDKQIKDILSSITIK